ncbi:MAG TPA: hypothetical protein VK485_03470 [Sphingomicrobium sp.]|nr:hypothetical protein [Sphingomicrobium sp.]
MRPAAIILITAAASACAASAATGPRTARAERDLQRELVGKVAGAPVKCLPSYRSNDMTIIDDNTILFRDGRNRVYRNDPLGGCSPMGSAGYTLVFRPLSGQMCRGDIVQVTDLRSRMIAGSCSLGDFVPYQVPGTKS